MSREPDGPIPSAGSASPGLTRATLEGVRARQSWALAELFGTQVERVFNLAFRLLGDRDAAEDATQDVFVRVHKSAHRIDVERDIRPWITAIVYSTCRDRWRSRSHKMSQRSRSLDGEPVLKETLSSPDGDPEADRVRSLRERLLMEALMKLPEPQRAVVILHDYHDLTHEEIAKVVGSSSVAVRQRYSRALAALRVDLEDRWP